ncbi:trypsin-like peptidase domain-containing protein [Calothrix sp. FACHB-156]|nr:trypsin-like peptidase domain-containing protein [Nostoc linckia FACHB-104]MBD2338593.1 trypsin-like peptidase domain-containing protein [Calothrix sp. FACHB-156]
MTTKAIYKQPFALFFAGILSAVALGGSVSVQAQTESQPSSPPKFTKFQPGKLKIQGNGNPFKPSGMRQSEKPTGGKRGIPDGVDDRIPMLSRDYPWSAIGRVQGTTTDAKSYHCTGTLIADDIVLTNSHCVIDPETHQLSKKILFLPNVINGAVSNERDIATVEQVIYGTDFTGENTTNQINDWAIMKINKPLGRKYGYLGWKSLPASALIKNKEKLFFVGYSGDFPNPEKKGYEFLTAGKGWTAGFQAGCSIVKEEDDVLFHDCDTAGGSSGGPIIGLIDGQPYIVALNNAEIKNTRTHQDIINLAVKISFLDELVGNQ